MSKENSCRYADTRSPVERDVIGREEREALEKASKIRRTIHVHKPDPETVALLLDSIFPDNPLLREVMGLRLAVTDGHKRSIPEIAHMLRISKSRASALVFQGIYTMNPSLKK